MGLNEAVKWLCILVQLTFDTPVSCEYVLQAYMQSSKFSMALF
jgi:hypothetical protein